MRLEIESTKRKVEIGPGRTPCRIWNGKTPAGTECRVLVALVALPTQGEQDDFSRELDEQPSSPTTEQLEAELLDQAERDAGVQPFHPGGLTGLTGFPLKLEFLVVTRRAEVRGYYFHPDPAVMAAKRRELEAGAAAMGWTVSSGIYILDERTLSHLFAGRL